MFFFLLLAFSFLSHAQINRAANVVYGQSSFFSVVSAVPPTASSLLQTAGIAEDSFGNLYISDEGNHRILRYPPGSTVADLVYGQADFTSGSFNRGNANPAANTLYLPRGLAVDSDNRLYVADSFNNRVLVYNFGQTTATLVYGQLGSFTTRDVNKGGVSGNSLRAPGSLCLDPQDRLYVMDSINNRILRFPKLVTTADEVYGQPNFVTSTSPSGPTKNNFASGRIHYDAQGFIWIADSEYSRVVRYSPTMKTSVFVYGQPDYVSRDSSQITGITGNSFFLPSSVFTLGTATDLKVFIADQGNNRILYYENLSTTPSAIFGQATATTGTENQGGISQISLAEPRCLYGTQKNGLRLYVCDNKNRRVLAYSDAAATTGGSGGGSTTTTPAGAGTGGGDNVCYHHLTKLSFIANGDHFTMNEVKAGKVSDCVVAHTVQSTGIRLVFEEGLVLSVTQNHLVAYRKGWTNATLFVPASKVTKEHRVICSSFSGECKLKQMLWREHKDTYFGLNCLNSVVYADGILTSTFENYHHFPALWMKAVGYFFGIEQASKWGDALATWAYRHQLI